MKKKDANVAQPFPWSVPTTVQIKKLFNEGKLSSSEGRSLQEGPEEGGGGV